MSGHWVWSYTWVKALAWTYSELQFWFLSVQLYLCHFFQRQLLRAVLVCVFLQKNIDFIGSGSCETGSRNNVSVCPSLSTQPAVLINTISAIMSVLLLFLSVFSFVVCFLFYCGSFLVVCPYFYLCLSSLWFSPVSHYLPALGLFKPRPHPLYPGCLV